MNLDTALYDLVRGERQRIFVASIDRKIAEAIGAPDIRDVYLSRENFLHIRDVHSDISVDEFQLAPDAIKLGLAIVERSRPNAVTFCYQGPYEGKRYAVAVKATGDRRELYLLTFHRMKDRQTRAFLRRGFEVRKHA